MDVFTKTLQSLTSNYTSCTLLSCNGGLLRYIYGHLYTWPPVLSNQRCVSQGLDTCVPQSEHRLRHGVRVGVRANCVESSVHICSSTNQMNRTKYPAYLPPTGLQRGGNRPKVPSGPWWFERRSGQDSIPGSLKLHADPGSCQGWR